MFGLVVIWSHLDLKKVSSPDRCLTCAVGALFVVFDGLLEVYC